MDFDRPFGSAELRSNLFVKHAGDYAFEHVSYVDLLRRWKSYTELGAAALRIRRVEGTTVRNND